jgi:hypothetical protein
MKKVFLVAASLSVFVAAGATAQNLAQPACPGGAAGSQAQAAQDACQQAYDIYQFMSPQLGIAVAGGNATLGTGSTLGGLGHFSIGVRANAVQGAYPQVNLYQQSVNGAQRRSLQTKDAFLPFPTADAAVGLFGGIPLGLTNVGAIDALVSATYIPDYTTDSVHIAPSQNWQIGYGARVGIIQESIVLPGVSLTWLKRDLPKTTITGQAGNNSFSIRNLEVNTTSWRLVASKSLVVLGFAAGFGQDHYENKADISATVSQIPILGSATSTVPNPKQEMDRTNMFADVSLNLPLFKIVGEAGRVSGGTVDTYNSFSGGAADRGLNYFSLGVRFGW